MTQVLRNIHISIFPRRFVHRQHHDRSPCHDQTNHKTSNNGDALQ
jgi:hypothetical protein